QYVLCFDDLHIIGRASEIAYVFKMIRQRLTDLRDASSTRVILLGREMPRDLQSFMTAPLGGFEYEEAAAFVAGHQISLPEAIVRRLWERTEGNAKLLELSVAAIEPVAGDAAAVDKFVEAMSRKGDVRDYLMSNIYTSLEDDDKLIMGALSVFPNAIDRDDVQTILEEEGLDDVATRLDALIARQLLDETADDEIRCHGLVRDYCYHLLSRADKDRFHDSAAKHFEAQANYLAAAHHYFERRDFTRALDLLATYSVLIINSGGGSGLLQQLKRFPKKSLSSDQWVALCKTGGNVRKIRGEYQAAVEAYSAALEESIGAHLQVEFLQSISDVYLRSGDYDRAIDFAERSLKIDQTLGHPGGGAQYHYILGIAEYRLGHLAKAAGHFAACEQLVQLPDDDELLARIKMNLGLIAWRQKELPRAIELFESSRDTFRRRGDRSTESRAIANLGLVYGELHDIDRQLACYRQAIAVQEELGDVDALQSGYNNLGYMYHSLQDYPQAIRYYDRLRQLSKDLGQKRMQILAYAGLADARLAQGELYPALEDATQAQSIGEQLGPCRELGVAERSLGDVWSGLGNLERAQAAYQRSIPMLEEANEVEELAGARQGLARVLSKLGLDPQQQPILS
ncbi:MAG TPA: tetratricopeptide repeat protein, partial [Anaerolineae bacterium]|nr:tetratricopeptide repeat protein [Anaerolineae bacterium]